MTLDELDRLAGENVMGLEHDVADIYSDDGVEVRDWHPTRNIAQAWQLLEKLDRWFEIRREQYGFGVRFGNSDHVFAETAPLAIVRACLRAKGVEV